MKQYLHEFVLRFTVESDKSCEDVDNYPSEGEFLEALLQRITKLRKSGGIAAACDSPIETINLECKTAIVCYSLSVSVCGLICNIAMVYTIRGSQSLHFCLFVGL